MLPKLALILVLHLSVGQLINYDFDNSVGKLYIIFKKRPINPNMKTEFGDFYSDELFTLGYGKAFEFQTPEITQVKIVDSNLANIQESGVLRFALHRFFSWDNGSEKVEVVIEVITDNDLKNYYWFFMTAVRQDSICKLKLKILNYSSDSHSTKLKVIKEGNRELQGQVTGFGTTKEYELSYLLYSPDPRLTKPQDIKSYEESHNCFILFPDGRKSLIKDYGSMRVFKTKSTQIFPVAQSQTTNTEIFLNAFGDQQARFILV